MPVSQHEWVAVLGATALTLLPTLGYLALLYRRLLGRAPLVHLLAVFAFSLLTIQPVGVLENKAWATIAALPLSTLAWFAVDNLAVGVIEEGVKFAFFVMLIRGPRRLPAAGHTILYAVAVSLGFAAMENARYAWDAYQRDGLAFFVWARGLIATPAHLEDGVLMGFFAGRALAATSGRRRAAFWLLSLSLPALSHAFYDICATLTDEYDAVPALLSTLAMYAALAQVTAGLFLSAYLIRISLADARARPTRTTPSRAASPLPAPCPTCAALPPVGRTPCRRCGSVAEPLAAEPAA